MKIYTKQGDTGETVLIGGTRVPKNHPRVIAYGAVDELSAHIGVILSMKPDSSVTEVLEHVQHSLFTLSADISAPLDAPSVKPVPRIVTEDTEWLERSIDELEQFLTPLTEFVTPGGTPIGAQLHLARTVCRRAERDTITLSTREELTPEVLKYINRLSDFLFVLSRYVNTQGKHVEKPWNGV